MDYDLDALKSELVDQVRQIDKLLSENKHLQSTSARLETELGGIRRHNRQLERATAMAGEFLDSSRQECDAINASNDDLVNKMEEAASQYRQQLSIYENKILIADKKFKAAQNEMVLDRKLNAEKDARIAILERDNAKLMTELEIFQSAVESMSSGASLAMGNDATSAENDTRPHPNVLGDAESTRRGPQLALGTGNDVPVFLRYEGWIPYRPISKAKVETMCKRIWALKTSSANSNSTSQPPVDLGQFFLEYMTRKIPSQKKKFEYIYNFVENLKKFVYDIDCDIFYRVLFHELSEDAFFDQMKMVAECQ